MSLLQNNKVNILTEINEKIDTTINYLNKIKNDLEKELNSYYIEYETKIMNNIYLYD